MKLLHSVTSIVVILLASLSLPLVVNSQTPDSVTTPVTLSIVAQGYALFQWIDDEICTLGFKGYDLQPDVEVYSADGDRVAREPLSPHLGDVGFIELSASEVREKREEAEKRGDDPDDVATRAADTCTVELEFELPSAGEYRVVVDPMFDEDVAFDPDETSEVSFSIGDGDELPSIFEQPSGPIPGTNLFKIAGTLTLNGVWADDFTNLGLDGCHGNGGYSDIKPGLQVQIEDGKGSLLAIAELEDPGSFSVEAMQKCQFIFSAEVEESEFYSLSAGRRGDIAFSFDDMEEVGWRVDLEIG